MERAPASTVARASTATKRKPRTASKVKAEAGKAKAGSTARKVRQRRVRKPARVTAKEYAGILETHWDVVLSEIFVKQSKAKAEKQKKEYGGHLSACGQGAAECNHADPSHRQATCTPGLCDNPLDGIEISNFKHSAIDELERTSTGCTYSIQRASGWCWARPRLKSTANNSWWIRSIMASTYCRIRASCISGRRCPDHDGKDQEHVTRHQHPGKRNLTLSGPSRLTHLFQPSATFSKSN